MWNQLDALTGLLNQNSYLNRTAEMRRSGGVLVVFDVDDFKQINDRYGHLQGDVCLAEIADCIKKAYARCGYCYRIGGDEFCVLLKDEESEARCAKNAASFAGRAAQGVCHFADGLPWLCRLFRGGRGCSEGPRRPRALLRQKGTEGPAPQRKSTETTASGQFEILPAQRINGGTPMNTDWNSPQGDFDTAEKAGRTADAAQPAASHRAHMG